MGGADSALAWKDSSGAFMTLRRPPPHVPPGLEPLLEPRPPLELELPPEVDQMLAQAPLASLSGASSSTSTPPLKGEQGTLTPS
jgi:hypothetical protein